MKTQIFKTTTLFVIIAVFFINSKNLAANNWKLVETKSGITTYERWVAVNQNLVVKERKGEMLIPGTLQSVINTIADPTKAKLWMENVSEAYLVNKPSDNTWYSYTFFSLPWPFDNRDMVAISNLNYSDDGETAIIEITSKESVLPQKSNAKRLNNYKAKWEIIRKSKGYVYVSFSAISYTAPEFPRFIQDPILRNTFLQNLVNLRKVLCS